MRVLVYFTNFVNSLGGSEYLPLLFVSELQRRGCDVTLALNWTSNIEAAMRLSGIPIDLQKLKVEYVKPKSRFLQRLDAIIPFCRTRALKRLARNADICISTVNMFDFGKPAHHFVFLLSHFGDNAFFDHVMRVPPKTGLAKLKAKARTLVAERFIRPLLGLRSTRRILADRREKIYPNSLYVEREMRAFYGDFNSTLFYPPTFFEFPPSDGVCRDPQLVVCIGRIIPSKRVVDIIEIVEKARAVSGVDLKLGIAGQLEPETDYTRLVGSMASERPWVTLEDALYGTGKEKFLLTGTYAVHARFDEEFGIAVAEYLKAGLIPVVPDEGGSCEVVDRPELSYSTSDDAAQILARLVSDGDFAGKMRDCCSKRAQVFSRAAYERRQSELLDKILKGAQSSQSGAVSIAEVR